MSNALQLSVLLNSAISLETRTPAGIQSILRTLWFMRTIFKTNEQNKFGL